MHNENQEMGTAHTWLADIKVLILKMFMKYLKCFTYFSGFINYLKNIFTQQYWLQQLLPPTENIW